MVQEIRLTAEGIWEWEVETGSIFDNQYLRGIALSKEGGAVVAGLTHSEGQGLSDYIVIKFDRDGNMLWRKVIGQTKDDFA